ncbi:hypothetical protein AA0472_2071 [Acetobacter estunensis NRIC 0472]|nr:hypothetical protein AA0472_2071 [Acetobacter estunensis NRIC 0472]
MCPFILRMHKRQNPSARLFVQTQFTGLIEMNRNHRGIAHRLHAGMREWACVLQSTGIHGHRTIRDKKKIVPTPKSRHSGAISEREKYPFHGSLPGGIAPLIGSGRTCW